MIVEYVKSIIEKNYLISKSNNVIGKFILKNYPNNFYEKLIDSVKNEEILFISDKKLNAKYKYVETSVLAQYRNENVKDDSLESIYYIVFITDNEIDTLNDLATLNVDDIKSNFLNIIELIDFEEKDKLKEFFKLFFEEFEEADIFEVENFISDILKKYDEGYPLNEAIGDSLIYSFKCQKCVDLSKLKDFFKEYRKISNYYYKKARRDITKEELYEAFNEEKDEFESLDEYKLKLIKEFIEADISDENYDRFRQLDYYLDLVYKLFEKVSAPAKKLGEEIIDYLEKKDIDLKEDKDFLEEFDSLKPKEKEKKREILKEIYEKYKILLEENPKLLKKIEKFLFPKEIKEENFFIALIKLLSEVDVDKIEISLNKKNIKAIKNTYSKYALNYLKSRLFVINKIFDRVKFNINLDEKFDNEKTSTQANELKFIAKIYKDDEVYEKRFIFKYPVKSILNGYSEDVNELIKNLDKKRLASYKTYINKNYQKISLKEYASFEKEDVEGYRFVDDSDDISDIIENLEKFDFVEDKEEFKSLLDRFLTEYKNTLIDITNAPILEKSYTKILEYLHKYREYDKFNRLIIKKFLNLVVIDVDKDLKIIPAYHPLRLISFYYKLQNLNDYINSFINKKFIKEDLFFEDLIYDFTMIHYPEIFKDENLLKVSEIIDEYSLLENVKKEKVDKNEEIDIFVDVVKEYIELNKHKKNIKIFLHSLKHFFPVELMNKLSKLKENIDIYFNDLDEKNIREIYRLLLQKEELFKFSEIGFISNVKLNTLRNSFKAVDEIKDNFNLAFLKDFITNKAQINKEELVYNNFISSKDFTSLISKRKFFSKKEERVAKYLITPIMNRLAYLFYLLIDEKIPSLSITRDSEFENLEKIHSKSDWVINLDEIADKKIIEDYGANVIKYKKNKYLNKNLIISSKANTTLLENNLKRKMNELNINCDVKEIIKQANNISGDIVLKALKQGKFTNELIGIVLSKKLFKRENSIVIYIDDYENYFKYNSTLSDLLIITLEFNNKLHLNIDIVESKFCSKNSNLENKSFNQAVNVYKLFSKIFSNEEYIDKKNYLIRLSDLIIENLKGEIDGLNSEEIRAKILFDDFSVSLNSYSCIFYYDSDEEYDVYNEDFVFQYKFNRKDIKEILQGRKKLNITNEKKLIKYSKDDLKQPKVNEEKEVDKNNKEPINNDLIEKIRKSVIKVLRHHNFKTNILDIKFTPNAIRVSLKPELGWKESALYKTKDDFLAVEGLELLRVEALKGKYDLVFKRENREIVYYKDLLKNRKLSEGFGNTKILVGLDESTGEVVYYDLDSEDPHALIGGMTKSGKSVLLNLFIIDLITTNSPDELRLFLIDPKQVEFIRYKNIPHLEKIVTKKEEAVEVLKYLVDEMERRYSLFMKEGVNEIKKYNKKSLIKLPRIVVIFDEFADWMLDKEFKSEVSNLIQSLSGKARAAGIHLIISTQRPSNDVVVPILRANLGAKFALRVDSEKNSNIILDEPGAEKLLGYGHMIAKFAGEKHYIQGAFISDEEIEEILSRF